MPESGGDSIQWKRCKDTQQHFKFIKVTAAKEQAKNRTLTKLILSLKLLGHKLDPAKYSLLNIAF
jgi:hypothetical protein